MTCHNATIVVIRILYHIVCTYTIIVVSTYTIRRGTKAYTMLSDDCVHSNRTLQ